ncbi:MAG: transposase [Desulfitobacteriaceae bacterium]|nr:transposase [Desulfitobacteriaceae bacterium]
MRHGHKASKGKFNGHKAQVLIDETSEIIMNIAVTPGNEADGDALAACWKIIWSNLVR